LPWNVYHSLLGAYCPGTLYRSPVGGLLPWDALTIQIVGG